MSHPHMYVLLLLLAVTGAPVVAVDEPDRGHSLLAVTAKCTSALDCSLNGECGANGACECDKPWKDSADGTEHCSVLDVLPHPNDYVPAYGGPRTDTTFHPQNMTSWGGNIIFDDAADGGDGMYVQWSVVHTR